jgi:hypothetical protein
MQHFTELDGHGTRILLASLLLIQVSCASWQQTSSLHDSKHPTKRLTPVRVELKSGRGVVLIHDPVITSDTLRGHSEGDSIAIPMSQVTTLEVRRPSTSKTFFLAWGVAFVAALGIAAAQGQAPGW